MLMEQLAGFVAQIACACAVERVNIVSTRTFHAILVVAVVSDVSTASYDSNDSID
jgi:hypothetical protein